MRSCCMKRFLLALAIMVTLAACASSQASVRKCNGQRGTRVPMGLL